MGALGGIINKDCDGGVWDKAMDKADFMGTKGGH